MNESHVKAGRYAAYVAAQRVIYARLLAEREQREAMWRAAQARKAPVTVVAEDGTVYVVVWNGSLS